jgi:serine/threonine-protein kinase
MIKLAVTMFERAIELDPEFAVAWARLSDQHSRVFHFGHDWTEERRRAARRAVDKALELEPNHPESILALAFYHYRCDRDFERALDGFSRVLAISPNNTDALSGRAWVLRRQGRWEEAADSLERVLELSPRDSRTPFNLSDIYQCLRDFQRAEEYVNLTISLAPDRADGYIGKLLLFFFQGRWSDAWAVYEELPTSFAITEMMRLGLKYSERDYEEALATLDAIPEAVIERAHGQRAAGMRELFECDYYYRLGNERAMRQACGQARRILETQAKTYPGVDSIHNDLGLAYAFLGRKDEAIREGEHAVALVENDALRSSDAVRNLANIYVLVGEHDLAIDRIEHLLAIPSTMTVGYLRSHPNWDPLRDNPRFQALLEKYEQR